MAITSVYLAVAQDIRKPDNHLLASKEKTVYITQQFEEPRVDAMHELIRAYPLATLVTHSSGGLDANHIPVYLSGSPAPYGASYGMRKTPRWNMSARTTLSSKSAGAPAGKQT